MIIIIWLLSLFFLSLYKNDINMNIEIYNQICAHIKCLIEQTHFMGNVYVCGGAVRDHVMKHEIKDIDICVELPNGGIELANWLFTNDMLYHKPVIYPTYGTAMFKLKEYPEIEIEAVQTRKEQYKNKNSRNPEVSFGTLTEDCFRRDLTINSLYYNITTEEYIDITKKGFDDIAEHVIRTTSSPDVIFEDDALRILRVIRFASRYGWNIDDETYQGMKRKVDRLSIITKERIQDEFNKMLTCDHPTMALQYIKDIGAMKHIIPELENAYTLKQNKYHFGTVWEHTISVVKNTPSDLVLRMSALLHDIGKIYTYSVDDSGNIHFYRHETMSASMCDNILKRLKYSNDFIKDVKTLVENHMRTKQWGDDCSHMKKQSLRKMEFELGNMIEKCLLLIDADNKSHALEYCMPNQVKTINDTLSYMKENGESMQNYVLPVNGNDVINILNIEPSKQVSECLKWLMKFAFYNPKITREELLNNLIKQYKKR